MQRLFKLIIKIAFLPLGFVWFIAGLSAMLFWDNEAVMDTLFDFYDS
jgi:hypothetical protein